MSLTDDILIERYLKGELSESEEANFSQRLLSDPEFKDKVLFEKQLFQTLNEGDWSNAETGESAEAKAYEELFKSEEVQGIKHGIALANDTYKKSKSSRITRLFFYPMAAAVLILVFFLLRPSPPTSLELYNSYLEKTELQTLNTRGEEQSNERIDNAQLLFDHENYEDAIAQYLKILESEFNHSVVFINLALAQVQTDNFNDAISTLDKLIQSNLLDAEKGYWYKSLVYLAIDQVDKSKELLRIIIDHSYYNSALAKELLTELE